MRRAILAITVLASVGGCKGKNQAPDCKAAASTYAQLVKDQIDSDNKDDESKRAQALSLIPSLKEEMAKTCEKKGWSETTRACIKNAKAAADLPHCMPKKQDEAEQPAPGNAPAPGGEPNTGH
jgi:hypothetical protein